MQREAFPSAQCLNLSTAGLFTAQPQELHSLPETGSASTNTELQSAPEEQGIALSEAALLAPVPTLIVILITVNTSALQSVPDIHL